MAAVRTTTNGARGVAGAVLTTAVLLLGGAACGRPAPEPAVEPLAGPTLTAPPAQSEPAEPGSEEPVPPDPAASGPRPVDPLPADPAAAVVRDVLSRYDRALTTLAARPAALDDPVDPARVAWDAVVVPGSGLEAAVTGRIRARAAEGVVVRPPADGDLSFVHRALEVVDDGSGTGISFTWCGWSPGIGIAVADGSVVDDSVAHARGTGSVRDDGAGWRLAALDETEVVVLGAGAADPCPDEVADATGSP